MYTQISMATKLAPDSITITQLHWVACIHWSLLTAAYMYAYVATDCWELLERILVNENYRVVFYLQDFDKSEVMC